MQAVTGTWKPEFKPFGLAMGPQASDIDHLQGRPRRSMMAKLDEIKKDLLSEQDQGAGRLRRRPWPPACGRCPTATLGGEPRARRRSTALENLDKRFGSLQALEGRRRSISSAGERALPAGRERRRQVDLVQPDLRRLRADGRQHGLRRRGLGARKPGRGAGEGHRHGAPAFQPGAAHDRGREPDAGSGQGRAEAPRVRHEDPRHRRDASASASTPTPWSASSRSANASAPRL